jgi:hypothetical protein
MSCCLPLAYWQEYKRKKQQAQDEDAEVPLLDGQVQKPAFISRSSVRKANKAAGSQQVASSMYAGAKKTKERAEGNTHVGYSHSV